MSETGSMPRVRTLTLRNRLEEIERVAQEVEAFAAQSRVPPHLVFDANLALDEVLTNVISYAWDGGDHEITVRLKLDDLFLVVEVEDDGRPFDPLAASEPDLALPAGERPVGGLGLSLVRRLMPELAYERRGDRNVFLMACALDDDEAPAGRVDPGTATAKHDVAVVRPVGRLDTSSTPAFESALLLRITAGERRIVVDFSALDYINSAGLRVLLVAAKRLAASAGAIAVAAPEGRIRSTLEMVGFASVFPVCGTVDEASSAIAAGKD